MSAISFTRGAETPSLIETDLASFFDDICARHPDVTAVVSKHQDRRLSYSQLATDVDALSLSFQDMGLKKGDRIAIWSTNCVEWLVTMYAASKAGLVLVNLDPAYRLPEAHRALRKVEAVALVAGESFKGSDYRAMSLQLARGDSDLDALAKLRHIIAIASEGSEDETSFDDLIAKGKELASENPETSDSDISAFDPVNIQFSSGMDGEPGAATLTHHNILNNAAHLADALDLKTGDPVCVPLPLFHCFGMVVGALGCLSKGATVVFPGAGFTPDETLAALRDEACVAMYGVPTMFDAVLGVEHRQASDTKALRTGVMAGAPCPIDLMNRVIDELGANQITIGYGMTETSPITFVVPITDPPETRVAHIGKVGPHLSAKIIDLDGNTLPLGEPGELCVAGYAVMKGYWNDTSRTNAVIDTDGFMHTGDLAVLDEQGYAKIVGRRKEMIIRGGENIFPKEIAEFLLGHPKIQDVKVSGVPDERLGEEILAEISADDGLDADEVRAFCKGKIAHYKIPKHIKINTAG